MEGKAQFGYGVTGNEDGSYVTAPGPGKSSNNVYDYNLYYGVAPADDAHPLTADPLLRNPGHAGIGRQTVAEYNLRSHSPAANSAKVIEGNGGKDFFGTAVPQCGSADRGASELKECSSSSR